MRFKILFILLLIPGGSGITAQVKIRLFADQSPETAVFTVTQGIYEIRLINGEILIITKDDPLIITKYNGSIAVKKRNSDGFICDSLFLSGKTGTDSFSLRMMGKSETKQIYSGDLQCFPDLETLVLINISDIEKYISGVVLAEGGNGKNPEYFKTQAILARTYMYKNFDKHLTDRYNLCDNTHCQAFNGISTDSLIGRAVMETKGLVILDKDSILIFSAFHSNCGGETSSSEDVWLMNQPYLKSVVDTYCLTSRNATWQKSLSMNDWINYLRKSGYSDNAGDPSVFNFTQESRMTDYQTGSLKIPLRIMRSDLYLKSTFFSVLAKGDSIIFKGRGYGHGVGLCQEGAMMMASRGFIYQDIINFYYSGVIISDIKNAKIKNVF